MSIITILSAKYCPDGTIIKKIASEFEYEIFNDEDIISKASAFTGISVNRINAVLNREISIFNRFSHEKEKTLAGLKAVLSDIIQKDKLIISGLTGQMIPKGISHCLSVCITSDLKVRIENALSSGQSEKESRKTIEKEDSKHAHWINEFFGKKDPYDPTLYDILFPLNPNNGDELFQLIKKSLPVLKKTKVSGRIINDFVLESEIENLLIEEGHFVDVCSNEGNITLTINKNVLNPGKLEEELKSLISGLDKVKSVNTEIGKNFYQADIYRPYNFEMPEKVLLVDDEKDFVQTLSERLLMRDMGSVVAYDGESALDIVDKEEPEVIVLDLRMPGMSGIEVLKEVKEKYNNVEIIILTGHGSEKDKEICMKLGAFAYLQKPVNIDVLSKTMKDAYKKVNSKK